jgi:hypothetical protein
MGAKNFPLFEKHIENDDIVLGSLLTFLRQYNKKLRENKSSANVIKKKIEIPKGHYYCKMCDSVKPATSEYFRKDQDGKIKLPCRACKKKINHRAYMRAKKVSR